MKTTGTIIIIANSFVPGALVDILITTHPPIVTTVMTIPRIHWWAKESIK